MVSLTVVPVMPLAGSEAMKALAGKDARAGTADCPRGSVDHRDLVLQQHLWFLPLQTRLPC